MGSEERFWAKVKIAGSCWDWTGSIDSRGYGQLRWNGKVTRAHRVAFTLTKGDIPVGSGHHGTCVMHVCDNRLCCNPLHLRLGDHAENMVDMKEKGRRKGIGSAEQNGRAVLTSAYVAQIRRDSRSIRTIAKDYPVSRAAIQRIKAGKAWAVRGQ